jgi:DNA-binding response OmpR family regulator
MRPRYRALVVDDDLDTLEIIGMVLEPAGFDIITAESGHACLGMLEEYRPDILILDLMLETVTEGIEIYHDIRNDSRFDGLPVVIVSAIDAAVGFPFSTGENSGDVFLGKPLEPARLRTSIMRFMQGK